MRKDPTDPEEYGYMKHVLFWLVLLTVLFSATPVGNVYKWWALIGLTGFLDFIRFPSNLR